MSKKKRTSKQSLHEALRHLDAVRELAGFDLITVITSDGDRHWQFRFGSRFLLSYWPASGKAKRTDHDTAVACTSPQKALRAAQQRRQEILAAMAREQKTP